MDTYRCVCTSRVYHQRHSLLLNAIHATHIHLSHIIAHIIQVQKLITNGAVLRPRCVIEFQSQCLHPQLFVSRTWTLNYCRNSSAFKIHSLYVYTQVTCWRTQEKSWGRVMHSNFDAYVPEMYSSLNAVSRSPRCWVHTSGRWSTRLQSPGYLNVTHV